VENILARSLGSRLPSNAIKRLTGEGVETLGLTDDVTLAVKSNEAVIETMSCEIGQLEARLREGMKVRHEYVLLKSIPGIR